MKAPIAQAAAEAASPPGCAYLFSGASKFQNTFKEKWISAGARFSMLSPSSQPRTNHNLLHALK
jgi:hypothetical protein